MEAEDRSPEPMPVQSDQVMRQASTTAPPSSQTRTASEAGTEADQRNVRARVDDLDTDLNADRVRLGVPVPQGGWIEAQRRQDLNQRNNGATEAASMLSQGKPRLPEACLYVNTAEIIPDSFDSAEQCLRRAQDIYFQAKSDAADLGKMSDGFTAAQALICFNESTQRLEVMLNTTDASGVKYAQLPPKEKLDFDKARHKEMDGLFQLKAYRLMSLEESRKFKREHPECVLPTRWVDRYKATDEGGEIAKSRIVILGFMDPHILQLERSAPTPTNEARTCV